MGFTLAGLDAGAEPGWREGRENFGAEGKPGSEKECGEYYEMFENTLVGLPDNC